MNQARQFKTIYLWQVNVRDEAVNLGETAVPQQRRGGAEQAHIMACRLEKILKRLQNSLVIIDYSHDARQTHGEAGVRIFTSRHLIRALMPPH